MAGEQVTNSREYGGIDRFRLIAVLLIVGIHTYPLSSVDENLNFGLVNVFARIAVPFFLMITGYFVLPKCLSPNSNNSKPLISIIKKTGLLYAGATLLYLPVSIYAGYYSNGNVLATVLKNIIFDGTFYHLWYLPALIIGILLFYALSRRFSLNVIFILTIVLYIFGLLGDSYHGFGFGNTFLTTVYDMGFSIFSYTRNGLFYTPVFLAMGAVIAKKEHSFTKRTSLIGFGISMILMLAEGFTLRHFDYQRHDSMYIALIPCMFFLFLFVLTSKRKALPILRDISMWIYILHPLFIIVVRGMAKITGFTGVLIENSVVHYLSVCLLSFVCAVLIAKLCKRLKSAPFKNGRAWIELDMENLRHNVKTLRKLLPDNCELMPAVKANAYGHGAIAICRELNNLGVRAFCVASVMEGVELRKKHIKGDILVLGYTHPEQFRLLGRYRLTQTVVDSEYAQTLNSYKKRLNVHVKIDTGMRRLGEPSENLESILRIFRCRNLAITGVYTHYSAQSKTFTQTQADNFYACLSAIQKRGISIPKTHTQSSYGVFARPSSSCAYVDNYARVGIALYGAYNEANPAGAGAASDADAAAGAIDPADSNPAGAAGSKAGSATDSAGTAGEADAAAGAADPPKNTGLLPVLSLRARISAVKTIRAGEAIGYGSAFFAPKPMRVAVVSIGYADGIPRALSCGLGRVLIHGLAAPIVGHVCMDQLIVDVSDIEKARQDDIATIIGKDGAKEISVLDLAKQAETIPNEILSRLGERLERLLLSPFSSLPRNRMFP